LINKKYIGNNVWDRGSFKPKRKRVRNTPEIWIRAEGAFEPIIDRSLFGLAQGDHPQVVTLFQKSVASAPADNPSYWSCIFLSR
jgi:hypothetical protein